MAEPFLGEIRIFAGNFAPRDWAFCDGTPVLIEQNTALFSILGTTFGGNGRTTFQLPDLQGRTPMHPGDPPDLARTNLGQHAGSETVTLTTSEMPSHTHQLIGSEIDTEVRGETSPESAYTGQMQSNQAIYAPSGATGTTLVDMDSTNSVSSVGSGQSHNNMQPFLAINYIIALVGIFPQRG
ncbi:MAG: tail fiber protein [Cyanobacteria bacterium P01_F01_bin.150]